MHASQSGDFKNISELFISWVMEGRSVVAWRAWIQFPSLGMILQHYHLRIDPEVNYSHKLENKQIDPEPRNQLTRTNNQQTRIQKQTRK